MTGVGRTRLTRYATKQDQLDRFAGLDSTITEDRVYFAENWMPIQKKMELIRRRPAMQMKYTKSVNNVAAYKQF